MNLQDAIDFIKKAKQPAAYFDTDKERFRFQNIDFDDNNKTIYTYSNDAQNIQITMRK